MRHLSDTMQAALAAGATAFCYCWDIYRRDGVRLGLTNHDTSLRIDDAVYHADSGIELTSLESRLGLAPHGPEVSGILGSPHLTDEDLRAGLYDYASFTLWLVDWRMAENRVRLLDGKFGAVRHQGDRFTVTLRGRGQDLNQPQGRVYQATCSADLGDKHCRFDTMRAPYQWRGKITHIEGHILHLPSLSQEAGWFRDGHVIIDNAPRLTVRDDRITQTGRAITLWEAPRGNVKAGDTIRLQVGCAKDYVTCRQKFNNVVNFQGFPTMSEENLLLTIGR